MDDAAVAAPTGDDAPARAGGPPSTVEGAPAPTGEDGPAERGERRPRRFRSLRWRLSVSFGLIAVLSSLVIGAVLVPVLAGRYGEAEGSYLEAAAERATRDLSTLTWQDADELRAHAEALAGMTRARVTLTRRYGQLVVEAAPAAGAGSAGDPDALLDPVGSGLLDTGADAGSLPRSDREILRPVLIGGWLAGFVRISDAPAYAAEATAAVVRAWAVGSVLAVLLAALAGVLVASVIGRRSRALTEATEPPPPPPDPAA